MQENSGERIKRKQVVKMTTDEMLKKACQTDADAFNSEFERESEIQFSETYNLRKEKLIHEKSKRKPRNGIRIITQGFAAVAAAAIVVIIFINNNISTIHGYNAWMQHNDETDPYAHYDYERIEYYKVIDHVVLNSVPEGYTISNHDETEIGTVYEYTRGEDYMEFIQTFKTSNFVLDVAYDEEKSKYITIDGIEFYTYNDKEFCYLSWEDDESLFSILYSGLNGDLDELINFYMTIREDFK